MLQTLVPSASELNVHDHVNCIMCKDQVRAARFFFNGQHAGWICQKTESLGNHLGGVHLPVYKGFLHSELVHPYILRLLPWLYELPDHAWVSLLLSPRFRIILH